MILVKTISRMLADGWQPPRAGFPIDIPPAFRVFSLESSPALWDSQGRRSPCLPSAAPVAAAAAAVFVS